MRTKHLGGVRSGTVGAVVLLLAASIGTRPAAAQDLPPPDSADAPAAPQVATAGDNSRESRTGFRQSDPVPPRMMWFGFLEPTGHTVARGARYAAAGYMGADWLAQIGTNLQNSVRPFVVHVAYGLTDDLMVGVGSAFNRFRGGNARFEYTPYATGKYRWLSSGRSSSAVGGFAGYSTWGNNAYWYGLSGAYSLYLLHGVALNAGLGVYGWYVRLQPQSQNETRVALSFGAEARLGTELRLVGELRSLSGWQTNPDDEEEEFLEVVSGGLRYLGRRVSAEVGVAHWFYERYEGVSRRPIVSLAYRF